MAGHAGTNTLSVNAERPAVWHRSDFTMQRTPPENTSRRVLDVGHIEDEHLESQPDVGVPFDLVARLLDPAQEGGDLARPESRGEIGEHRMLIPMRDPLPATAAEQEQVPATR